MHEAFDLNVCRLVAAINAFGCSRRSRPRRISMSQASRSNS
jgi:hypothetical protein